MNEIFNIERPVEIMLVEDDSADIDLTTEFIKEWKTPTHLHVVKDGVEALKYLRREEPYVNACRPDLILLDLNLPKKDGRELLQEMIRDADLRVIPRIILTTSDAKTDIINAYNLGANCFITKPLDLEEFAKVISSIERFWLDVAQLPSLNYKPAKLEKR